IGARERNGQEHPAPVRCKAAGGDDDARHHDAASLRSSSGAFAWIGDALHIYPVRIGEGLTRKRCARWISGLRRPLAMIACNMHVSHDPVTRMSFPHPFRVVGGSRRDPLHNAEANMKARVLVPGLLALMIAAPGALAQTAPASPSQPANAVDPGS